MKPIRILVVDDNPADIARIKASVELEDVEFVDAESVEAASRLMPSCDVVLLDLGLPPYCGTETLDVLRPVVPEIPIVIYSGNNDQALVRELMRKGAALFLRKEMRPEAMNHFFTQIAGLGEQARARRERARRVDAVLQEHLNRSNRFADDVTTRFGVPAHG